MRIMRQHPDKHCQFCGAENPHRENWSGGEDGPKTIYYCKQCLPEYLALILKRILLDKTVGCGVVYLKIVGNPYRFAYSTYKPGEQQIRIVTLRQLCRDILHYYIHTQQKDTGNYGVTEAMLVKAVPAAIRLFKAKYYLA